MENRRILFYVFLFFTIFGNFASADEYELLQKEINSLKTRIDKMEKNKVEQSSPSLNQNVIDFLNNTEIHGRLHIDARFYENKDFSDLNNKVDVRRARLSITTNVNDFIFNLEGAYNNNTMQIHEAFIGYNFSDTISATFGQIVFFNFMERGKSSNTMPNVEYSATIKNGWIPWSAIGLNFKIFEDRWGIASGVFGNSTEEESKMENNSSFLYTFRSFASAIKNKTTVLHFGADFMYNDLKKDLNVNPDNLDYKNLFGLEFAYQYKMLNFTAEFIRTFNTYYDNTSGAYNGGYVEFYANLTGEYNKYASDGTFGNIDVKHKLSQGGLGAFQFVTRYSVADGKSNKKYIGYRSDYSFGLNWIPENNVRFLLNYSLNKYIDSNRVRKDYNQFTFETRVFF